jgi:hypothetical protein
MKRYFIQSGPLQLALVAPSAYDAALEAIRWWDPSTSSLPADAAHRAGLDAVIEVRASRAGQPRLFPTFKLLARAIGQSPSQAWERVLGQP